MIYFPDVSTLGQPSSAAYEQKYIKLSNYNRYTKFLAKYSKFIFILLDMFNETRNWILSHFVFGSIQVAKIHNKLIFKRINFVKN